MALKYGFYDSVNGDRAYSGHDFTTIMNNLIMDGVLPRTVGRSQFGATPASSGLGVTIDSGWAWFDSTYTYLTAAMTLTLSTADAVLYRWDAVVIETDAENRENAIKVIEGTPAAETAYTKPTLATNQHPLCYVKVRPGVTQLVQSDIENRVGLSDCPFITGVVGTADLTQLFAAWQYDFETWFSALETTLSGDVAANLYAQIQQNADAISNIDNTLSGKAEATALESLAAEVGEGGFNCRIFAGTYTGSGASTGVSLSFPFCPAAVIVAPVDRTDSTQLGAGVFVRPAATARLGAVTTANVTWSNSGIAWTERHDSQYSTVSLNESGKVYYYFALGYTPQS